MDAIQQCLYPALGANNILWNLLKRNKNASGHIATHSRHGRTWEHRRNRRIGYKIAQAFSGKHQTSRVHGSTPIMQLEKGSIYLVLQLVGVPLTALAKKKANLFEKSEYASNNLSCEPSANTNFHIVTNVLGVDWNSNLTQIETTTWSVSIQIDKTTHRSPSFLAIGAVKAPPTTPGAWSSLLTTTDSAVQKPSCCEDSSQRYRLILGSKPLDQRP